MFNVIPLPIFEDNYIWIIEHRRQVVAVDPGDAAPLMDWLQAQGFTLAAVLITHHHHDHVDGLPALRSAWPNLPVYGPRGLTNITHPLDDGATAPVLGHAFDVLATPGHTLDHLSYYGAGLLLCGDTLFAGGCGRLFEGTPAQMHASLLRLAALPDDTLVCCTHEYTLANLAFAQAADPANAALTARIATETAKRAANRPTLPSTIALEKATNPYLRCSEPALIASARKQGATSDAPEVVFAALRNWKNHFRQT
ncbi:hydroxyacylglutathione hydrolase [Andreprevotia lacus DSM 23236]|jgi:hydroxyacylglutathione hydrolase|uniref:Hydroxyacylglutathione hydrolase n=1 Tax=Andreprevotia lacus DSM 23236 TaxID=1121001 RepID=A0A1W1XXV1_9NEIS|nr:hydroxyacylglutathione hydrolase [Andreprevotia lacus]SMC28780.1 hydroxyacylglutathione hydrolase [Andreprevotia lacus DSM 23236]